MACPPGQTTLLKPWRRQPFPDKKRAGGDITLVVPRKIGHCELRKVPVADLLPIIRAGLEA